MPTLPFIPQSPPGGPGYPASFMVYLCVFLEIIGRLYYDIDMKGVLDMSVNRPDLIKTLNKFLNILSIVVIFGFFLFSMIIGGSAFLGYQENGRYFVRDHGTVVEVSQVVWKVSYIWGVLFLFFLALAPIGLFIFQRLNNRMK